MHVISETVRRLLRIRIIGTLDHRFNVKGYAKVIRQLFDHGKDRSRKGPIVAPTCAMITNHRYGA